MRLLWKGTEGCEGWEEKRKECQVIRNWEERNTSKSKEKRTVLTAFQLILKVKVSNSIAKENSQVKTQKKNYFVIEKKESLKNENA